MTLTLNSKNLLEKLLVLVGVINSSNTLPILDCFLFDIDGSQLKITASDLETTISSTLEITSTDKGAIAVPARMLIDILKSFPDQPLTFSVLENSTIDITSASGIYSIAYSPAKDFPKPVLIEDAKAVQLNSKVIAKAVSKTVFATGTDDLRPIMMGVLFQFTTSGLNFVATDAHKMVRYTRRDVVMPEPIDFIVPKKPLNVLKGILSSLDINVDISFNQTNAIFSFDDYVVICRLVDGKYPNYEAVIPVDNPNKALINRSTLSSSVKCVSIFSNKTTKQLVLGFNGNEIHLSAEDIDYSNKANERLACSYQGADTRIGFNSKYLSEMISNLSSEEINFEFSLPNRAAIMTPADGESEEESTLMLIMPTLIS
ncbi:DNA polymerase III subunit beta [Flavobacterium tructae]|uniref:Beta sliding clamp n=1 Tax=Flavobacterium tructae TaxID=1114873 RepID=A0A1S1J3U8_9FLAO|nr:DNA polymerase III subunit beta [Flavobacterium tructae]OHT44450.1 DNA polymerase III subunit beta [Flavobacterium tructae]OXB19414.1 DNA polymerase III subunit beta [Flavobacterium tructae]